MPQLDPEFYLSQTFWVILTFGFLFIFLWKITLPRIGKALEKRSVKIDGDLEEAKKLQSEAEEIQNKIDKILKKTNENSKKMMKDHIDEFNKNVEERINLLDRDLEKKIYDSSLEIEKSKKESLKNIHNYVDQLVSSTITKLTGIEASKIMASENKNK
tara:strand:+ start:266 stop:739 length:474 start_codon:yes stop_codon:yes gene_type:complete